MNDNTLRRVVLLLVVGAAVFAGVAIQAVRNVNRSVATSDWVNHTHATMLEAEALRAELHRAESALRAYVGTGNVRDAAVWREAQAKIEEHLEVGLALTKGEPASHQLFTELAALAQARAASAAKVVEARRSGDADALRAALRQDVAGEGLGEIQGKVQRIRNGQMALLAERDRAAYLQAQSTRWTVWSGVGLGLALLGLAGWLVRDDIAARRRAAAALSEANERLETRVQERTAALADTNARLTTENLERQWANHALEHQLRYSQLIVDSISDLVFVVTKALNVSRVNPAVVHMTGLQPPELINRPLSQVVQLAGDPANERLVNPVQQALRDGRDLRNFPTSIRDKRGRPIPAELTLLPLRDGDKVVGGVVTLHVKLAAQPTGRT